MWGSLLALGGADGAQPGASRDHPSRDLAATTRAESARLLVRVPDGRVPAVMVPLTLLHVTPMFKSWADGLTKSSTVRHVQLGMGVLVLSIAVLITVRALIRRRQPTDLPTPAGNSSTLLLDRNKPTAISRLLGRTEDSATGDGSDGSAIRPATTPRQQSVGKRLLVGRIRDRAGIRRRGT